MCLAGFGLSQASAADVAPAPRAHLTCPPKLTRRAGPGRRCDSRARTRRGTPTGNSPPGRASCRRGSRGTSPLQAPSGRPSAISHDNCHHANPGTTPIRSRVCRTAPRRSASSCQQGAFYCPSSRRTTRVRPAPTPRPQSSTSLCSQPGRHIPTAPPSAIGSFPTQRRPSHPI